MIDFMLLFSFFILGFGSGVLGSMVAFIVAVKRVKDKPKKQTVEQKMDSFGAVTEQQLKLLQLEAALRAGGQDATTVTQQITALEDEKFNLLKSILADGADPELTAVNTKGEHQKMKLSTYLSDHATAWRPPPLNKVESKSQRLGKFTVIKGGKDDSGGGNTSH